MNVNEKPVDRWIRAAKTKAIRLIYDAKATAWAHVGPPLEHRTSHPGVVERILLRDQRTSVYDNVLEKKFHGAPSQIRFFHPPVYLYVLNNVWITGSEGHIFFDPNVLFSVCSSLRGVQSKKVRRPIGWLSKKMASPVFILSSRAPGNRGHFLIEHLPRLIACREVLNDRGVTKCLVTPGHRCWQIGYLEKMGIRETDVLESSFGSVFCAHAYFVPVLCEGDQTTLSHENDYRLIRDVFLSNLPPPKERVGIFLSRKDAPDRRLINEDELFDVAKSYCPSLIRLTLSALSLDEQIQLFRSASFVIGPHSQAFRNVLFCRHATVVQLLQGARDMTNEYYHWAKNYGCIGAIADNQCVNFFSEISFHKNSDWVYPADKLKNDLMRLNTLIAL